MPLISVIIPAYNSSKYLQQTIASVLFQSFADFELIIVDDCSTDDTRTIISQFTDERIRCIKLESNHGGPSRPRNIGIMASRGRYVSLFDSDDIMLQGKLDSSIATLESNATCQLVFTDAQRIDEDGNLFHGTLLERYVGFHRLLTIEGGGETTVLQAKNSFRLLFEENFIPTSSVTLRRTLFDEIGLFDESLVNGDDRDLWFRLTRRHNICFLDQALHQYRIRKMSVSKRGILTAQNRIRVLEKHLAEGLPGDVINKANKLIAENYCGIAYSLRSEGKLKKSLDCYFKSLQYKIVLSALPGLLVTIITMFKILFAKLLFRTKSYARKD